MRLRSLSLLATTALCFSLTTPAFADSITFTLGNPTQTIAPGQTATFAATVTAAAGNGGNIYLNGDSANVADVDSVFTIDDSDFFANFPLLLTQTGPDSTFTGSAFTVTNSGSVNEVYSGSFTIYGGADANASDALATASFGSSAAMTVTPEPSSLMLLGTGVAGLLTIGKRRLFS